MVARSRVAILYGSSILLVFFSLCAHFRFSRTTWYQSTWAVPDWPKKKHTSVGWSFIQVLGVSWNHTGRTKVFSSAVCRKWRVGCKLSRRVLQWRTEVYSTVSIYQIQNVGFFVQDLPLGLTSATKCWLAPVWPSEGLFWFCFDVKTALMFCYAFFGQVYVCLR